MENEERNEKSLKDELSGLDCLESCSETFTLELEETYNERSLFETTATEFENILRESNADSEKKIEELEQEKHSLLMKLEIFQKSENQYESLLKEETTNLKFVHDQTISEMERKHFKEISQLKNKKDDYTREINLKEILLEQKNEKIAELEARTSELENKQQNPPKTNNDSTCVVEDPDLKSKNEELLEHNKELQATCNSLQMEVEGLALELGSSQRMREELEMDNEHLKKDLSSHYSMINVLKQQKLELGVENDALKFSAHDPNKRGNSLFAEVDDKRVEIQRQLISAQTKLKGADKKFQQQVNYTLKLKAQIVQLMANQGSKTDKLHIMELRSNLEDERSRTKEQIRKISQLEEKLAQSEQKYVSSLKGKSKSDPDFVKFLENLLKEKDEEIEKGKLGLEKCKRELLSESFRTTDYERELHKVKRERDSLKSMKAKFDLELVRLKIKCDEKIGTGNSETVTIKERIVFNPDGTIRTDDNKDGNDFEFIDGVKQVYNPDGSLQTNLEEKENLYDRKIPTTEPEQVNPVTSSKPLTSSRKVTSAKKREVDEIKENCKQQ